MKIVLDTNVLLSGVFTRGLCEALLDACLGCEDCTLVLSEPILREFARHASKEFGAPVGEVRSAVDFLHRHASLVEPAKVPADACRDPDDLPVLGTAVAAGADCLVTGDGDLLELGQFRGVPIISPRAFHDRLA